jgi:hypothetical protein
MNPGSSFGSTYFISYFRSFVNPLNSKKRRFAAAGLYPKPKGLGFTPAFCKNT